MTQNHSVTICFVKTDSMLQQDRTDEPVPKFRKKRFSLNANSNQ